MFYKSQGWLWVLSFWLSLGPAQAQSGPGSAQVQAAIQRLSDKDPFVRRGAAAELGMLRDSAAVTPLIQALSDSSAYVRSKAADSLGLLRARTAVGPLRKILEKDQDSAVRRDTALALAFCVRQRKSDAIAWEAEERMAVQALVGCLRSQDVQLQHSCIQTLGALKAGEAVKPLTGLLGSSDAQLKASALRALGEIGTQEAFEAVQGEMGAIAAAGGSAPPDAGPGEGAAGSGSAQGDEGGKAKPGVVKGAGPESQKGPSGRSAAGPGISPVVEEAAVRALAAMERPEAAQFVRKSLDSKNHRIRGAACKAMARMGDKSATARCLELLSDVEPEARRDSAEALGMMADTAGLAALKAALAKETDPVSKQNMDLAIQKIEAAMKRAGDKK